MDVWFPKLGFSYPQVALVDGFASTGRYRDGQHGSPLVMLKAYVERSAEDRARFEHPPHCIFIESKRSFAQHLQAEIDALGDIGGAQVDVIMAATKSTSRALSSIWRAPTCRHCQCLRSSIHLAIRKRRLS
jgi:three-Cys-motif partner protein